MNARWKTELVGKLASFGLFQVMGLLPLVLLFPLPASGIHWESLPVCGPYLLMEYLASLPRPAPSLGGQPIMGMVSSGWAPPFLLLATKSSAVAAGVAEPSSMLSKYQSAAWLCALSCQL